MHPFDPGYTGMSEYCNQLVMRDGYGATCAKAREHPEHYKPEIEKLARRFMEMYGGDKVREPGNIGIGRIDDALLIHWFTRALQTHVCFPETAGLFGGWTPTYEGDPCQGGHPGFHHIAPHLEADGNTITQVPRCNRCGRVMDLRRCGCPEHENSQLSRSYCPTRVRQDQTEVLRMARLGISFETS